MIVRINLSALGESRWYEHVMRFALGGLTTVVAGLVAQHFGPATGGLFLAFPAIFCASATLIEKHERKRKQERGLRGDRRGQEAAALDAAGAGWGSIGLGMFALAIWCLAPRSPAASLSIASVAWLATAVVMWRLRRELPVAKTKL